MSARAGLLAAVLARAEDWLLEPADVVEPLRAAGGPPRRVEPSVPLRARPVVAVAGLGRRCGVTTVARAIGAELAARERGACAITCARPSRAPALGLPAAGRLARALSDVSGAHARPVGRLCLVEGAPPAEVAVAVRYLAPLVLDVAEPAAAAAAAALADHVILVARPEIEPALAAVTAASLARVGPDPLVVLNRAAREASGWKERAALSVPEARMGAQLALGGREARGELGRAVATLVDGLRTG